MGVSGIEQLLYDCNVYDAWQFVINTEKTISTAEYCEQIALGLIEQMSDEHQKWQENLYSELFSTPDVPKRVTITSDSLPAFPINIVGVSASAPFILDKIIKDFFQYCRNAFDCIAQIANVGCLASKAKKIEAVDFMKMVGVFQQQQYSTDFPSITAWFKSTSQTDEFKYLDAFCNRTKHICDVHLELSMAIFGNDDKAELDPFVKKGAQQEKQSVQTYLSEILRFVKQAYSDFLLAFQSEVIKQIYTNGRHYKLKCHQQNLKDGNCNFSVLFIEEDPTIDQMPDEIQILLLNQLLDCDIESKNCPFENIYVLRKGASFPLDFVGKYTATTEMGDDALLQYRKYSKQPAPTAHYPYIIEIKEAWDQNKKMYHSNPFFDITTITDDDDFALRVQLPF